MTIKPLNDNVLIKLEPEKKEKNKTTESGIILTKKNAEKRGYNSGTVIALGSGRILNDGSLLPHIVNTGDRVLFYQHAGVEVFDGEDQFLMVKENEIIALNQGKRQL